DRIIYMDGRPHPSPNAPHTWAGFSTGTWEGDVLTIKTTHLKEGYVRRNGLPRSDLATLTEHWLLRGDVLTVVTIVTDPVYLTEPFIRSTGYWISVVTEDWRWRMVTPAKGDVDSVPLNAEGRRVANAWDPQRDERAGEACRAYAAPAIMRVPGRLHITWSDDATLRIDTEAGTQTRLLRFTTAAAPAAVASGSAREPAWQGDSVARWELGGRGAAIFGGPPAKPSGALRVVTTHTRPGYLRKN